MSECKEFANSGNKIESIVEIINLVKTYHMGEVEVLATRGISLSVGKGEFLAVMGPSGSGKSTLMNILGCLDKPTSGSYILDGVNVSNMTSDELAAIRNEKLGFVFQGFNLLSRTTALENVEIPMLYSGRHSSLEREENALSALRMVGLEKRADHVPSQMSGGEQQRVAIARALVNNPPLILADEPTGNLDTKTSIEIMDIFQKLNEEKGITVIMVTHEPDISKYAKRIIHVRDGKLRSDEIVADRLFASDVLSGKQTSIYAEIFENGGM